MKSLETRIVEIFHRQMQQANFDCATLIHASRDSGITFCYFLEFSLSKSEASQSRLARYPANTLTQVAPKSRVSPSTTRSCKSGWPCATLYNAIRRAVARFKRSPGWCMVRHRDTTMT